MNKKLSPLSNKESLAKTIAESYTYAQVLKKFNYNTFNANPYFFIF